MSKKFAKYRMQVYNKPSLMDKACSVMNLGESIQYRAMEYIFREAGIPEDEIADITAGEVGTYHGEKLVLPGKFILNDRPINRILPFSPDIEPVFVSSVMLRNEEITDETIAYLKAHQPIGSRDEQARDMLNELGIENYLMGCFTMCFPTRTTVPVDGKVFLVDVSENLEKVIPPELMEDAVKLSHAIKVECAVMDREEDDRLNRLADVYLERYRNEAKLVITSRLHAAAPCIAMGIPVIVASDNIDFRYSWLDKYVPIYTIDEYDKINWSPKAVDTSEIKRMMFDFFSKRLRNDSGYRDALRKMDEYYMDRNRVDYYGFFRRRIEKVRERFGGEFRYIIWGAGFHSGYAYDLIQELYPNAELISVIDKYEKGTRFGCEIVNGEAFRRTDFDFAFITTKPGTPDAVAKMQEIFGENAKEHYVVLTSQQIS